MSSVMDEIREEARRQGRIIAHAECVRAMVKSFGLTAESAMDALNIPDDDRPIIAHLAESDDDLLTHEERRRAEQSLQPGNEFFRRLTERLDLSIAREDDPSFWMDEEVVERELGVV